MNSSFEPLYIFEGKEYYEDDNVIEQVDLSLLYEQGICKKNSAGNVVFYFVGILTYDDIILIILPKYISENKSNLSEEDKLKLIVPIIKILKEYSNKKNIDEHEKFFLSDDISGNTTNEIVICDHIIRDYMQYGIYEKYLIEKHLNGNGETDWTETIDNLDPIFSMGTPIYSDTYNIKTEYDEYHIITNIHKWAVQYSINKYSELLGYTEYVDFTGEIILDYLDTPDYTLSILKNELDQVYEDRKIMLLKMLIGLVKRVCNFQGYEKYRLYGTRSFHSVWEHVLKVVLEDEYDKYCSELDKASWYDIDEEFISENEKTLTPDIIRVMKDQNNGDKLYILDAKYYNIKFMKDKIDNKPGTPDITKQFLYEAMLKERLNIQQSFNAFLFPSNNFYEEGYIIAGKVKMVYFAEQEIKNIYVSAPMLYDAYLSGEKFEFKRL